MKIEHANGTYFLNGKPAHANRVKGMYPVESQRALATWYRKLAKQILSNPKAIAAAIENAKRLVGKADILALSAALDEDKEVEWNARILNESWVAN